MAGHASAQAPDDVRLLVARTLVLDHETTRLAELLRARGIDYLLLKGASFARWLYPEGGRWHRDVDLLVAPSDAEDAAAVLRERGYRPASTRFGAVEQRWWWTDHPSQVVMVELHWSLPRVAASPALVWSTLSGHAEVFELMGTRVRALDVAARCFHVVLHAAQHGAGDERTAEDLRRALVTASPSDWVAARDVAERLGALDLMAAGFSRLPESAAVADELGLPQPGPLGVLSLLERTRRTQRAMALQRWSELDSSAARTRMIRDVLLPSREFLREQEPLASRGAAGLTVAYVLRWLRLTVQVPSAWLLRRRHVR